MGTKVAGDRGTDGLTRGMMGNGEAQGVGGGAPVGKSTRGNVLAVMLVIVHHDIGNVEAVMPVIVPRGAGSVQVQAVPRERITAIRRNIIKALIDAEGQAAPV